MSSHETEHARWFAVEVQPHEPALRAYLQSHFPLLQDPDDVIQETYKRLWVEQTAGRIRHVRAFMFTAARNVALDLFRRTRKIQFEPLTHPEVIDVVKEAPSTAEALSQQQELEILAQAVQKLPDRCRQVMLLRYLKGCSYKEISALLDISPETVKTHLAKGIQQCTDHFAACGLLNERRFFSHEPR
ncbi:RNA polymerase sigma factor [Opitutus terrae]|uniref:RNA polymerase, sigma-24 subunit, ECF subfamily n=1 Tax=Opitutus terrae (strain DSM 11246 / JCM 15787 / PB90-1) TaxID=452637 RepID=B1ZXK0_OPITP|nr:sigma-70 family RNA polymerase sigma factor [Opitutus terrae]ACB76995.1 RNA polymerase, sigma-24 subunit, ECF subfamily [Opitutus terrae PB90-1]